MKVWLDGEIKDGPEAGLNLCDHGVLYGDGVFEGIRSYGGVIFMLQAHLDRLFEGARALRLPIPYSKAELTDAMVALLKANDLPDGYLRLVVTRGPGTLGLNPFKCHDPRVFIIADRVQFYPKEMYADGLEVVIASTMRMHPNTLSPRIKSLNYLNNIMARIEAVDAGAAEAIMLNTFGMVAEATGDNVFIVRKGALMTPPVHAGILEGITRNVVMKLARDAGLCMSEQDLTRYDLYSADEVFLTGTAAEVIGVAQIDSRPIGEGKPGPVTQQLQEAFHTFVRQVKN